MGRGRRLRSMSETASRVLDSHVHFWSPARLEYPWLASAPALEREFLPEHFGALADRTLEALIFVEANCVESRADEELDFVDALAAGEPRIVGRVAFVDMMDRDSRRSRLAKLGLRPAVVGVRQNVQGHAPGYCLTDVFVDGVHEA